MNRVYVIFILFVILSTAAFAQLTVKNNSGEVLMRVDQTSGDAVVTLGSSGVPGHLITETITITDGAGTGKVLTSDTDGNASWASVSITESDPQWSANDNDHAIGNEFPLGGNAITISADRTVNHANTSSQSSLNNSGRTVIQDVSVDGYGHITGMNTTTLADNVNDADHDPVGELQTWNEVIDEGNVMTGARNPVLNNRPSATETHVSGILHFGDTTAGFNINRQTWGGDEKLVIGAKSGYLEFVTTPSGQPETHARICIQANGVLRIRGLSDSCHTGDGEIDPKIYLRYETP